MSERYPSLGHALLLEVLEVRCCADCPYFVQATPTPGASQHVCMLGGIPAEAPLQELPDDCPVLLGKLQLRTVA